MFRFAGSFAALLAASSALVADRAHNVILFVADGLRSVMVDDANAPTMAALARSGAFLRTRPGMTVGGAPRTTPPRQHSRVMAGLVPAIHGAPENNASAGWGL